MKKKRGSRQSLIGAGVDDEDEHWGPGYKDTGAAASGLSPLEKRFLLLVERGDVASIKRLLEARGGEDDNFSIDCVDPLGRSALTMAIENENYQLIQLLISQNVQVKDGLLHAIKEEYVEAVEILLEWEEQHHTAGTPYSWEAAERDTATFTPDITPLILAAHKNNYEILKILLDRGATLPLPHHVKCGCDICLSASQEDSLRYSRSRINAYRALASPSLICLSAPDPFLTAFELSWELRRLARAEAEFSADYNELRAQCQEFTTTLLGHARTSVELQTLLNHQAGVDDTEAEGWSPGEKQSLSRLRLAIKYKQKKFVAHPSVQQLLASMWYEGLPGFRRKPVFSQMKEVLKYGLGFPVFSICYMLFPNSSTGKFMRKPFVKFITHSSSYMFFLTLLAAASQRFEYELFKLVGETFEIEAIQLWLEDWSRKERGALPGFVESMIIIYILAWVWTEIKELYSQGVISYTSDLWNVIDFISNACYVSWFALRATAVYLVMAELKIGHDPYYPREHWSVLDPMLLSEGMFGAGMIFSFLKLVHIFSVNPHLGPIQISLGRMIIDILKFFFIYTLVLFAFGCGLNQLLWYYAELERKQCYSLPGGLPNHDNGDSCFIWRRFANLFETSQSLFWASFGLVELEAFELEGIKGFTRFWALLMFGSYSLINIIVLLNMLIAMMSTSYQIISERSDSEWKFARSKLWISYFEDGATVPAPFNIIPTIKSCFSGCGKKLERKSTAKRRDAMDRYLHITRLLVRRYVSAEETRKQEEAGISEDDVNEIRQDISSFRFELVDILKLNGMRTPTLQQQDHLVSGRKGKVMERRLMKDFQIGVVENAVREAVMLASGNPMDVFARIAQAIGGRKEPKDWNAVVRSVSFKADHIGSKQTSLKRKSIRRKRVEEENKALFSMDPTILAEYNPKLVEHTPATRVAYAKFKTKMLISHAHDQDEPKEAPAASPAPSLRQLSSVSKLVDAISVDMEPAGELPILDPILKPTPATPKLGQERRVEFVEVKIERQQSASEGSPSASSLDRGSSVQAVGSEKAPPQPVDQSVEVPTEPRRSSIKSTDSISDEGCTLVPAEPKRKRSSLKQPARAPAEAEQRRESTQSSLPPVQERRPSVQSLESIPAQVPERRDSAQFVTQEQEPRMARHSPPLIPSRQSISSEHGEDLPGRRPSSQSIASVHSAPAPARRPSEQTLSSVPEQSQSRRPSELSLSPVPSDAASRRSSTQSTSGGARKPSATPTGKSIVTGQTRSGWL